MYAAENAKYAAENQKNDEDIYRDREEHSCDDECGQRHRERQWFIRELVIRIEALQWLFVQFLDNRLQWYGWQSFAGQLHRRIHVVPLRGLVSRGTTAISLTVVSRATRTTSLLFQNDWNCHIGADVLYSLKYNLYTIYFHIRHYDTSRNGINHRENASVGTLDILITRYPSSEHFPCVPVESYVNTVQGAKLKTFRLSYEDCCNYNI